MKKLNVFAAIVTLVSVSACGLHTQDDNQGSDGNEQVMTDVDNAHAGSAGTTTADAGAGGADAGGAPADTTDAGTGGSTKGGSASTGGSTSTGGAATTGGSTTTEPTPDCGDAGHAGMPNDGSGGSANTGGSATTGGSPSTGGAATTGGTSAGGTTSSGGAAGNGTGGTTVVVPDNADVAMLSKDGKTLMLSTRYIFSAKCAEVLGNMPGVGWDKGPKVCDDNVDGYVAYAPINGTVGTYTLTYRDAADPTVWALYGGIENLKAMSPEARSFVECNWWNASTKKTVEVANPGCSLKATFGLNGIVGAGNMANLQ